ncbi:putative ABC transport system permease protein [Alteromonadaceae bacterium Bs31]|nr:putative ABC transport system permease protein [Alteromonadaceae bacterium Bs31]
MLIKLAWQSLCFRRGAVLITVAALAVSVFTLLSIEYLRYTAKQSFSSTVSGVDLLVGPRTGDINLLLTTVFRIGQPSQNMSLKSYQYLTNLPDVSWSIPISLGDSHRGFRVVGTEKQFFTRFQYGQSRPLVFSQGKAFTDTYEVVLGASVARDLGYKNGQKLVIAHGLGKTSFKTHDAFPFIVSGLLEPTGTPVDNALYVRLAGLDAIHHTSAAHLHNAEMKEIEPKSISAAMVGLSTKLSTFKVQREINTSVVEPLTAILPGVTLTQLWQMSRGIESVIDLMAKLILFASLLGMGAVMIATLRERFYEFSVLRTLGAGVFLIFILIQVEGVLIGALGLALGGATFLLAIRLFGEDLAIAYGIDIATYRILSIYFLVALYVLIGALIVGIVPASTGYLRARKL